MPILKLSGLHYLPYDETKLLKKSDERDGPSLKIRKEIKQLKNSKKALPSFTSVEKEFMDLKLSISMTIIIIIIVIFIYSWYNVVKN